MGMQVFLDPRRPPAHPLLAALTHHRSSEELHRWAETQPLDLRPPTDERPFFFNLVRPSSWLAGKGVGSRRATYHGNLQATRTLVYATLASTALAGLALLVPLVLRRRKLTYLRRTEIAAALAYFALIGLGFMFVELGLLSRLSVYLGHPTLALAVLLAGIILFTGIGSLLSNRLVLSRARPATLYPLIPFVLLVLLLPLMRLLMDATNSSITPVRIAISVLLIAPPAMGLGLGFPVGLRLIGRLERARGAQSSIGPWLWGINGACGVTASGLALACSMAWGMSTTLLVGAACYGLLTLVIPPLYRAGTT
jgi:hypothetical protein